MKSVVLYLVKKFLGPEAVAKLLVRILGNLLRRASKSKKWDLWKTVVQQVEKACHLFDEVYADDNMDAKEEELVAAAIEELADKVDWQKLVEEGK